MAQRPAGDGGPTIEVVETPDVEAAIRERQGQPLPAALPVLPLRDMVPYPDTLTAAGGRPAALDAARQRCALGRADAGPGRRPRPASSTSPAPTSSTTWGSPGSSLGCSRSRTARSASWSRGRSGCGSATTSPRSPTWWRGSSRSPTCSSPRAELEALTRNVQRTFTEIIEQIPYLPEELQLAVTNVDDPSALAHLIAGALRISTAEKQELLEEVDVGQAAAPPLRDPRPRARGDPARLQDPVAGPVGDRQGPARVLPARAAEGDPAGARARRTSSRPRSTSCASGSRRRACPSTPESRPIASWGASSACRRRPPSTASSAPISSGWWSCRGPATTEDDLDIAHAREVLDADHYDLEKVKDRILEYLAVRKLTREPADSSGSRAGAARQVQGPILCFVGPPGVGKTSLGRSIAKALGRKFERISVGGVRDEAEIRGHRRTYIGAMPGTIIRALRDAGSRNPVFMIDEIDKMGADFRGDPAERHARGARPGAERQLPRPLPGPRVRPLGGDVHHHGEHARHGPAGAPGPDGGDPPLRLHAGREAPHREALPGAAPDRAERAGAWARSRSPMRRLRAIIEEYTREAGVRNLEREIGSVCRKVAREVAEGKVKGKTTISAKRARELLGRRRYFAEQRRRTKDPGVATGLAWTPVGGEVLFVEATAMPGDGKLTITGQLGEVMRESAQAALSWVRGNVAEAGAGAPRRLVRRPTTSTSMCPPAPSPRMALRPGWRWRSPWPRWSWASRSAPTWR